jgi:hypothetical protein
MNIDKFGGMHVHSHTKFGGMDVTGISNDRDYVTAAVNTDKDSKLYIDQKFSFLQEEIKVNTRRLDTFRDDITDHFLDLYRRETFYLKSEDFIELFKEHIDKEKDKLIQSLLNLVSGKIRRPVPNGEQESEKINQIEVLALLEAWRK